ncbi:MAG: hypothetical protein Q8Q09_14445 [Deltaproteobacteria bacterium]|nr:hypothetical protein [Deltaproteobacteria bacterium]
MNSRVIQLAILSGLAFAVGGCGQCNLASELSRVLSDQPNVLDCGTLVNSSPLAAVEAAAACAGQAVRARVPFKLAAQLVEHPNAYYAYFARVTSGEYTVYGMGQVDAHTPNDSISVGACLSDPSFAVVPFRNGTAHLSLDCRDIDYSPAATTRAYAPPASIPNGRICPLP